MLAWDRWVRRRRDPGAAPASPIALLLLGAAAVATHPLLDFLNVYGIRLLMPFSDRWFYGDVLFIVDPWIWLVLAAGVVAARRRGRPGPSRAALAVVGFYVGAMALSGLASRRIVARAVPALGVAMDRMMSAPVPVTPFRRWVVVDVGDAYRVGEFDWLRSPQFRAAETIALRKGTVHPAATAIAHRPDARRFLDWARFPVVRVREGSAGTVVEIIDTRYAVDADAAFGALSIPLSR
jgi:inner membrane protein